jgi:hypothetical protein
MIIIIMGTIKDTPELLLVNSYKINIVDTEIG